MCSLSRLFSHNTHPTWDAHPLVHEFLCVCVHVCFSQSQLASSLKFLLISAELCGCLFSRALRTSYMFSCYGRDKLLFKKKKILSVFLTRSQVPSSVFSVHSWSQYTGIYWVLDTPLNIERMKNMLKNVITRVIALFY